MKYIFALLFLSLLALTSILRAEPEEKVLGEVATDWPGIHLQVFHIERIAGNRVLVAVKMLATAQAPLATSISVQTPIPKNADPEQIKAGLYGTAPFSLESAVMTNDLTKETYAAAPRDPAGPNYLPSQMLGVIHQNGANIMTVQFMVPPPPPDNDGTIPKMTVSIDFPKTKGPVTKIVIPPPVAGASKPAP